MGSPGPSSPLPFLAAMIQRSRPATRSNGCLAKQGCYLLRRVSIT